MTTTPKFDLSCQNEEEVNMDNEMIETLKAARALIAKPENWTQGCYARDADGNEVPYGSGDACSLCAIGAIGFASYDSEISKLAVASLAKTTMELDGNLAGPYNDSHTHAEVLAAFDLTVARLETQA